MKKQVWKWNLSPGLNCIPMPQGAEILTAREQDDAVCIWALVDPEAIRTDRYFEAFGTGHNMVSNDTIKNKYIGTAMLRDGKLVFHVFERINI